MTAILATVKDGKLVPDDPLGVPEGRDCGSRWSPSRTGTRSSKGTIPNRFRAGSKCLMRSWC